MAEAQEVIDKVSRTKRERKELTYEMWVLKHKHLPLEERMALPLGGVSDEMIALVEHSIKEGAGE